MKLRFLFVLTSLSKWLVTGGFHVNRNFKERLWCTQFTLIHLEQSIWSVYEISFNCIQWNHAYRSVGNATLWKMHNDICFYITKIFLPILPWANLHSLGLSYTVFRILESLGFVGWGCTCSLSLSNKIRIICSQTVQKLPLSYFYTSMLFL